MIELLGVNTPGRIESFSLMHVVFIEMEFMKWEQNCWNKIC